MNNHSKIWFLLALVIMLIGTFFGPYGGGITAVGIALFVYTWGALRRAETLRRNIVSDLTGERVFDVSRLVVNQCFSERLLLQWHGEREFDMAICREEQLSGIRYMQSTRHLISLVPNREVPIENEILFKTIGHFSLGAIVVGISSDWGVAEVSCPVKINSKVLVHPKLYPSLTQGVQNSMVRSFSSGIHRFRASGDGAELYEIRDYVSGDPFKKILWSATAKTGKLIVRENETEVNIPVMFLLNTSWFLRFGSPKMMFDQLVETALGVADASLRAGDPFGFCLYGDAGQADSNCFILPDNGKNKVGVLLHSLLGIHVQQTPPERLNVPVIEKNIKNYLQTVSGHDGEKDISALLIEAGYVDNAFSLQDPGRYAALLNRIAEEASLPVPVLHSRLKVPDAIEKKLEFEEVDRLKKMLLKILPQIKGHAVFVAAVRPYENDDTLLALSNLLRTIPAFHHTLIILYPDYSTFAEIKREKTTSVEDELQLLLNAPYSAENLIRLDYDRRLAVFKQNVRRNGGIVQDIDASKNAAFIMAAINRLRTIQGGRRHA